MDRNLIFAVLITTIIIILFSSPFYQKRFGRETTTPSTGQTQKRTGAADSIHALTAPVDSASKGKIATEMSPTPQRSDTTKTPGIEQVNPPLERQIVLENEAMKVTLLTRGGVITSVVMKKHLGPSAEQKAQLVIPGKTWCDGTITDGENELPFTSFVFSADSVSAGCAVLNVELIGGRKVQKVFTLSSSGYILTADMKFDGPWTDPSVTYELHGALNQTEPEYRQLRIWPFSMFMNTNVYMDDKLVYLGQGDRLTDDRGKQNRKRIYSREGAQNLQAKIGGSVIDTFSGDLDWYAVKNKYFIAAAIPAEKMRWKAASSYERDQTGNRFDFAITKKVSDGSILISLYTGPILYEELKAYGHNLPLVMDLSWRILRPIAIIFLWMFRKLHAFIPNWGLVLIVFSIIIKIVLYPLSKSSTASMKKMSKLQPQITTLREKYKNDSQRLHKATMELYKQEGVNPFGGCLPMLLQMPVFFALYPVVGRAFELRHAMFIPRWIDDLSRPDPYYILPVAMGVSMYFQQKSTIKDPTQKPMLYMMPVLMVILFANFSAGLTLYWLMFNLISWAQQDLIK
jgi:YidC/Oxa1 family membrane protein insertase